MVDGSSYWEHVASPIHEGKAEQCLVFDVETLPKYHPYAIMASVVTPNAWYTWISPWLLNESAEQQHLIPLGDPTVPKVIIGHNVSYDRGRVLEEYSLGMTMNRFIDTMALHVAVKGISSHQRPAWTKYKKAKEVVKEQHAEAHVALVDYMQDVDRQLIDETDEDKRATLSKRRRDMQEQLNLDDDEEADSATSKRWEELTSVNSLRDVAKLHVGIEMDKEIRNDFMTCTPSEILAGIHDYVSYNITDVEITHKVFQSVFPEFLERCPHPVSFAGILTMGSSILPVNSEWDKYVERSEKVFNDMLDGVKDKLKLLAEEARAMMEKGGGWEDDPWLSQLDWTPKVAGASRGIFPPQVCPYLSFPIRVAYHYFSHRNCSPKFHRIAHHSGSLTCPTIPSQQRCSNASYPFFWNSNTKVILCNIPVQRNGTTSSTVKFTVSQHLPTRKHPPSWARNMLSASSKVMP